jgi:hypothetical protein
MLATFCLRLACGLIAALLLLRTDQVNPRFLRTHFLTALGLLAVAAFFLRDQAGLALGLALGGGMVLCFLGSVAWSLEGAPGGRALRLPTAVVLTAALLLASRERERPEDISPVAHAPGSPQVPPVAHAPGSPMWSWADDLTSAALLGSATTAMLIGHSYLLAPAMSLTPLLRLLAALLASTLLRLTLALAGLWLWTGGPSAGTLEGEMALWLPLRWGLGFIAPLVLGWMAWETARIRSTQSATGILYVVVICCFLGELTSQLLLDRTGLTL